MTSFIPWWAPAASAAAALPLFAFFLPAAPQWVRTAVVAVLVAWAVYGKGRDDCRAEVETARQIEHARQVEVNRSAVRDAVAEADALAAQNAALESALQEIVDEVRNSPDADACGIDAGSLRKLDSLTAPRAE